MHKRYISIWDDGEDVKSKLSVVHGSQVLVRFNDHGNRASIYHWLMVKRVGLNIATLSEINGGFFSNKIFMIPTTVEKFAGHVRAWEPEIDNVLQVQPPEQ